ncbi:hypothetical protein ACWDV4_21760 [Micromonospora sp. NPDC003197]
MNMPHQPPMNTGAQGLPPAVPPSGRRARSSGPGKVLLVLAVVVSLVLSGLVGAVVGGVTGTLTTGPEGPSALPSTDASFPTVERRYLPGVKVSTVTEEWLKKANSYTCTPPDSGRRTISEAAKQLQCEPPGNLKYAMSVGIEFGDEAQVRYVRADCWLKPGSKVCVSLFATFADALMYGNTELRKQAYEWAEKNAETDNVTTIGGIRFTVRLEPRSIVAEPAL